MDKFSLITVNNTISDTNADVSYTITCSNPDNTTQIKYIEIDIQSLADMVNWSGVRGAITGLPFSCILGPNGDLPQGVVRFTLTAQTNFKARKNQITISITNLFKKDDKTFPPSSEIKFKLKTVSNTVIGAYPNDYNFNNILVAVKKPIINSFKINPSITRESTEVTLTYDCINASTCEIKDKDGATVDIRSGIDKTKPFSFTKKVHLGSNGTFPSPPFYLHAKDGVMEAVDYTVSEKDIKVPASPDWNVLDNFSEQILVDVANEGTENEKPIYNRQQNKLLDLVLNERADMLWAIVQKRTDLSDNPDEEAPCIWNSPDGLTWAPHLYSGKNIQTNVIQPVKLTIPAELVHCPCVHFGKDELFFVGGSKIDIGICKNTITAINLNNGGVREIAAPAEMKPRSLHACVVYPDADGNNNVWVIGGADKVGNGLNDVWRFDGTKWIQVAVNNPAFPKRCQFAATVQIDVKGVKSIWIGAGASRYNGSTLNDLWVYKGGSWAQVKNGAGSEPLGYRNEWVAAASLCYVRTSKNSAVSEENTYQYILSNDISGNEKRLKCSWILGKDIDNNYYDWNPIDNINKPELPSIFAAVRSFAMVTIGFNGCVWTVAVAYIAKGSTSVSNLYYSCPVPQ